MPASLRAFQHGSPVTLSELGVGAYFSGSFYHGAIIPMSICTAILGYCALPSRSADWPKGFGTFMVTYLSAWTLCVAADWLQGPYVYALYEAYGFTKHEIAELFVAGFGSAMVSSCFVGGLADRFGRKKGCVAYCLLYIFSCATKHWKNYWVLMVGRVTGGFATSLLFSCFECWMVSEHTVRNKFSSNLLSYMFGMKFTLMYLVAIMSGFMAQIGVDSFPFEPVQGYPVLYMGGNTVAFDMSAGVLLVALLVVCSVWSENYGASDSDPEAETSEEGASKGGLVEAWNVLLGSTSLSCLIAMVACFEGAMYAFVFNWTPSLETPTERPPHGVVFALMMMACMCGASTSTLLNDKMPSIQRLQVVSALAVCAFALAGLCAGKNTHVCFMAFLIFEFCVGVYFPSIGTVKSELVPERIRATMYNMCRVPLNAVVVGLLLTNLTVIQCFRLCAILLAIVFLAAVGVKRSFSEAVPEVFAKMK